MAEIIYSKFSNERNRKFAIRTDILEEKGERFVKKTALYPEGKIHEKNLLRWYRELDKLYAAASYQCNVCTDLEDGVQLQYVIGETLQERLDRLYKKGALEEAEQLFIKYLKKVQNIYSREVFECTDAFKAVFGEVTFEEELLCAGVTNIDMICANLVMTEIPVVLDYEWTFDFPVPAKFVLYRIIFYFGNEHGWDEMFRADKFYEQFGISEELRSVFAEMEYRFQMYITGNHIPMRDMYDAISPGTGGTKEAPVNYLQIFFSEDGSYTEEASVKLLLIDERAEYTIPVPENCRKLRLDTGEVACAVKMERLSFGERPVDLEQALIPEGCAAGEWVYMAKEDPYIADIPVPDGAEELSVSLQIYPGDENMLKGIVSQCLMLKEANRQQMMQIEEMENTKVWKMYTKYRGIVEK